MITPCTVGDIFVVVGTIYIQIYLIHAGFVPDIAGCTVERQIAIEVDSCLTSLTTLGGDDDNTISTLSTIDGGRGSVLQDVHRFDVVGRDVEG